MAGYVEVSNYDIRRLARHFKITPAEFEEKHLLKITRAGKKWLKDADKTCQFLSSTRSCTVYDARPTNCRGYVCWDQDDKEVYEFARFAQTAPPKLVKIEAEELAAEQAKEKARLKKRRARS
jgi:Fe-S-cluster containining protein